VTLYLAVTPDELELPLYVAETEEEMAAWAGIKVKTVREQCSRNKKKPPQNRIKGGGAGRNYRLRKILIEEEKQVAQE
jgi:hypothetical protein